jgi:magnesium transporter
MVTKGLTVVATMSIPFVVVSGMWGMNFARVPLADLAPRVLWLLVLQLALGLGLLVLLRRRGWL